MDYEAFKQEIVDSIKDYLPDKYADANVTLQAVTKNNDHILDGIVITSPDSNVSPTIYLNSFFEQFKEGMPMEEILEQIAEIRDTHEVDKDFNVSRITDWDQVSDKIAPRVVDSEHNAELLAQRPHTMMDGMAVTYCIMLGEDENGSMSIPITNQLMENWGLSSEQIHAVALENLPELMPPTFKSMNEVMAEMMLPNMIEECGGNREEAEAMLAMMMPPEDKMFVVSNEQKLNGAAVLLNEKQMDEIAERFGGDFYILPSSIHECLIVPRDAGMELSDLEAMVQDVNATQVALEDRLSDHVFSYDSETKEVYRADHEAEHIKAKEAAKTEKEKPEKGEKAKSEKQVSIADRMKAGKEKMNAQALKPKPMAKAKEAVLS